MVKDAISLRELANSPKLADMTRWLFLPYSEKKALRWMAATLAGQITAEIDAPILGVRPL